MSEHLPVEVVEEILKRLPVKLAVKCRSVCKTWNILIKNSSFISTHSQTSLSKPHNHLFLLKYSQKAQQTFSLHFDDDKFDELKQLHFPLAFNDSSPYFKVVGSCNGLVCLCRLSYMLDIIFWNPSIQKYIALSKPNITFWTTKNVSVSFGFGFDSITNDYKLVILLTEEGATSGEAYLYSLNDNSWKKITASFPECAIESRVSSTFVNGASRNSAFVNGALHWMGYQRGQFGGFRNIILGFDISTEEFFVISLPENLIGLLNLRLSIMKYEESSIAALRTHWENDQHLELWIMKKYGVVGSWTKVLQLTDQRVLGFRKNGEVLLQVDCGKMVSLDLNCQQMEHVEIDLQVEIVSVHRYMESLILLDKGVDAGSVGYSNDANDSYSEEESKMA
ncbi:hypothetical protein PTKIN_Ptkin14bG0106400 [Pterospermum kingtungense]